MVDWISFLSGSRNCFHFQIKFHLEWFCLKVVCFCHFLVFAVFLCAFVKSVLLQKTNEITCTLDTSRNWWKELYFGKSKLVALRHNVVEGKLIYTILWYWNIMFLELGEYLKSMWGWVWEFMDSHLLSLHLHIFLC